MKTLVEEICGIIREHLQAQASSLSGEEGAVRVAFRGPPAEILAEVLSELTSGADRGIAVRLANGSVVVVPVVMPLSPLPSDTSNPAIGLSGVCDAEGHVLAMRNSPACPRFLVLESPEIHGPLSLQSATDLFGVARDADTMDATTSRWLEDPFVSRVVEIALARSGFASTQENQARRMLHVAVDHARIAESQTPGRYGAWQLLDRLMQIDVGVGRRAEAWSLACGMALPRDEKLDATRQARAVQLLMDEIGVAGYSGCFDRLAQAASDEQKEALLECRAFIQATGATGIELTAAPSHYFLDRQLRLPSGDGGHWRQVLDAETLLQLLDAGESSKEALGIVCLSGIVTPGMGLPTLVRDSVELEIRVPITSPRTIEIEVARQPSGGSARATWQLPSGGSFRISDDRVPMHSAPIRYTADSTGLESAAFRAVSLASWGPGAVNVVQGARRITLPKLRDGVFVSELELVGTGRHDLDIHLAADRTIGTEPVATDVSSGEKAPLRRIQVSDALACYELEATTEFTIAFEVVDARSGTTLAHVIAGSALEQQAEGCPTEFERLVRLNKGRDRSKSIVVVPQRTARTSDLQTWTTSSDRVASSFLPIAISDDCRDVWAPPSLTDPRASVLSRKRLLHDPRPERSHFHPPPEFLETRRELARLFEESEHGGLLETIDLGARMQDATFSALVDGYLRSYSRWLDQAPDVASWVDLVLYFRCGPGDQLDWRPHAVMIGPLHPLKLGWHCCAQAALWHAWKSGCPCPAASILSPDTIPDSLALPLLTARGTLERRQYLSVETSSDYWSVLWDAEKLTEVGDAQTAALFAADFGIQLGGLTNSFSAAQVGKALSDASQLLAAKPTLNVLVTGRARSGESCNIGLTEWIGENFSRRDEVLGAGSALTGVRVLNLFDERPKSAVLIGAQIANIAEDSGGAVRWYSRIPDHAHPDLAILAQLEATNQSAEPTTLHSALSGGGLVRWRIRAQLPGGNGSFLTETRSSASVPPTGDSVTDLVAGLIARSENLGAARAAYTFAPNVLELTDLLHQRGSGFVAVSSASIDPSCFLGGWLGEAYLWDYELPSYSHRAGDSNGYYLLTRLKPIDLEAIGALLAQLPIELADVQGLSESILLEVARRGIPTVRGLSSGTSGASGDLGLFLAGRLIQDSFRTNTVQASLTTPWNEGADGSTAVMIVPVDPFRCFLEDLQRGLGHPDKSRPDLIVVAIDVSDSSVRIRLTPIEVKYRRTEVMPAGVRQSALKQAVSLSQLLSTLLTKGADDDNVLWRLAGQHFMASVCDFGFRVYSQQGEIRERQADWSRMHARVIGSILSGESRIEVDNAGRLIVLDQSPATGVLDLDGDGFNESLVVSPSDAAVVGAGSPDELFRGLRRYLGDWRLSPTGQSEAVGRQQAAQVWRDESPEDVGGTRPVEASSPALRVRDLEPAKDDSSTRPGDPTHDVIDHASALVPPSGDTAPGKSDRALESEVGMRGIVLELGQAVFPENAGLRSLHPCETTLNNLNMGIVGDLGTGKTQLIKSLVYQIHQGGSHNQGVVPRFLIFDYKKDYASADFVGSVNAKVVAPRHLPLNLFDVSALPESTVPGWLERFRFFADVLDKIYGGVGPVQRGRLKEAVKQECLSAMARGTQASIYDVYNRYSHSLKGKEDSVSSILSDMVDMELFTPHPAEVVSFDKFLQGVVVLSLADLGQDDKSRDLLVVVILSMFYDHMLRIPKRRYVGTEPQLRVLDSYLLVDEADNILRYDFEVLRKILLQGREFGVGVLLASQYLSHFKAGATDYREPLLTWFVHMVRNLSGQDLAGLGLTGAPNEWVTRIKGLPVHHCLYKSADPEPVILRGVPFFELVSRDA